MGKKWLILDCNYLCHRAKYATPDFSYGGSPTGVIYGFLRFLPMLQEELISERLVFCWDSRTNKRYNLLPEYKAHRRAHKDEMTAEEIRFEKMFRAQMRLLRQKYLPLIGFSNVFVQKGMESDDLIASICKNSLGEDDYAVIVSSDHDLYQLLCPEVSMYDPIKRELFTWKDFRKQYHISPRHFAKVKALAGCTTDNVPGIQGVGEITACKYLRGVLSTTSKIYAKIEDEKHEVMKRNRKLVQLPLKGTKVFPLRPDNLTEKGWQKVVEMLGMSSLKDRMPFAITRPPKIKGRTISG